MPHYHIQHATVAAVFNSPDFDALCAEYAEEALRNPALANTVPDREMYDRLDAAGMLAVLVAVSDDNAMVGFASVLMAPCMHHAGKLVATVETLFLAKAHRKGGAGLALLREAEALAKHVGAAGLYASAPVGGSLERILPRIGYTHVNTIFWKE